MSIPKFATSEATVIVPATDAQISYVLGLLVERDYTSENIPAPYISRAAVVRLVIDWARNPMDENTPAAVSRAINDTVGRTASYGQRINALLDFLTENSHDDEIAKSYVPFTKEGASKMIEWLKTLPFKPDMTNVADRTPGEIPAEVVPAGRYAIDTNDGAHNGVAFYKVDRPTEGKWVGRVFVKLMVSDEEQRLGKAASATVLAKIAEVGAEAASARYGHEIGECGVCGRTLTNDASRARGIGPVCAEKAGW
jgi:hypothetical protein